MARKRKSGTGTIRQRKDGRWEGRAVVGYDDKGLPKTKNVLAKTKHECQEKLTKLMETAGSAKSEKICADMPLWGVDGLLVSDLHQVRSPTRHTEHL